ncbi:hypothetical protein CP532_5744 [Ophiocordyceps camponoti-leonardi (nom. inval.)]|nr:hypothetical protein CP532_5744 [Ophiocordyceps camponoti-leonardi (nom. inval.)]
MTTSKLFTPTEPTPSVSHSWRERLEEVCRKADIPPPVFQFVSDRRGGRTAWSSKVVVHGKTLQARFWYDGKNLNNATEDAAECALNWLIASAGPSWGNW